MFSLARPFQPNRRPSEGASRRVGDSSTLGVKVWLKFWQKQLKNSRACLAGGFNPFEKYARHIRTNHWWIQYLFQHSYVPRWVSKKDRDATVAIAAIYSSLMNKIQQNRWYPPRTSPVFSYWNFTYPNSPCPSHMTHHCFLGIRTDAG